MDAKTLRILLQDLETVGWENVQFTSFRVITLVANKFSCSVAINQRYPSADLALESDLPLEKIGAKRLPELYSLFEMVPYLMQQTRRLQPFWDALSQIDQIDSLDKTFDTRRIALGLVM